MVRCSFIYPCWTGTACCSLLTWAETKWVRQLIIHGAIISSINMVITGLVGALANSKLPLTRRRIPQREIVATLRTLQLVLWDPVGSECFSWGLWDFLLLGWRYLPWNNTSHSGWLKSLLVQGSEDLPPVCFGVQLLASCVGSSELSWEILSPET